MWNLETAEAASAEAAATTASATATAATTTTATAVATAEASEATHALASLTIAEDVESVDDMEHAVLVDGVVA